MLYLKKGLDVCFVRGQHIVFLKNSFSNPLECLFLSKMDENGVWFHLLLAKTDENGGRVHLINYIIAVPARFALRKKNQEACIKRMPPSSLREL